jgi:hypothetical protein
MMLFAIEHHEGAVALNKKQQSFTTNQQEQHGGQETQ